MPTYTDFANNIGLPNLATNAMQNFIHNYTYDELGNILQQQAVNTWTREFVYDTDTNRLLKHDTEQTLDDYTYDKHGNTKTIPHLSRINWDYADRMQYANLGGGGEVWYVYSLSRPFRNASGERVRKVIENNNIVEERLYLGGFEIWTKTINGQLAEQRETLHVYDSSKRIAIIDTELEKELKQSFEFI